MHVDQLLLNWEAVTSADGNLQAECVSECLYRVNERHRSLDGKQEKPEGTDVQLYLGPKLQVTRKNILHSNIKQVVQPHDNFIPALELN